MNSEPSPLPDYERSDASPRFIALAGGLLALGVALSLGVSALLYTRYYHGQTIFHAARLEQSFRHGPKDQSSIAHDWADQDRLVQANLHTYGWIDRPAGIVRIPIDRAMDLVAAESVSAQEAGQP